MRCSLFLQLAGWQHIRWRGGAKPWLLALAVLVPSSVLAQACPPPGTFVPELKVNLSPVAGSPVYSSELSVAQVNALAGNKGANPRGVVVGLTVSEIEGSFVSRLWSVDLGGGRRCVGLDRIDGHLRLKDLKVYIGREYPPGACNYARIRDHEDQHVAINTGTFRAWVPRMEAALAAEARRMRPWVTTADMGQVRREVEARLDDALRPQYEAYRADMKARNAAIDTEASYRSVMGLCPKW